MCQFGNILFARPDILNCLEAMDDTGINELDFGVIGFDAEGMVSRYNDYEARVAGLAPHKVLGRALFTDVAQCMNNYLVAQRFADARADGIPLDETVDYVLTWRMCPTKVKLRMLSAPDITTRYVLLYRLPQPKADHDKT